MIIDKHTFEAFIIYLYKTGEFDACEKLFVVYKAQFAETPRLRLLKD